MVHTYTRCGRVDTARVHPVPIVSFSCGVRTTRVNNFHTVYTTTMLRAYTTYSITVVAESDVTDSSEDSEPVTVTAAQTSKCSRAINYT